MPIEDDRKITQPSLKESPVRLLWDVRDVADALSVGTRTLWRWVSTGAFPGPDMSIGGKIRRWRRETVLTWINEQTMKGRAA